MKKLTLITAIILLATTLIGQSFQIDIPGKEINPEIYKPNSKSNFLKQPYLIFEGINTQMRVIWQLSETASCNISWGTDSTYSLGNLTTTEYGDDHQHGYTINGLTPGMKYHYKVVYDDDIFQASFYTAPPEDEENIKFFVYGDTRSDITNHDNNSEAMISNYMTDPDFQSLSLFTGDHVDYGAEESSWDSTFFTTNAPNVRKRMAELPFVPCLGNHEMYDDEFNIIYNTTVFGKYFPFPYVERRYWSFDYGPMHVAILDHYPDYYQLLPLEGFLDTEQLEWLEEDLSNTNKPWKVIIIHEPGWSCEGSSSGYSHPNNPDVQNLLQPILEEYGAQIVFTAHNHYYARACKNGIYHITTAGGGAPLYEIEEEFPNVLNTYKVHHYCKVAIEGDTMTVTAVKPDGEVIDEFQLDQNNRPDHLLGFLDKEDGPGDISDVDITADGLFASPDSVGYYGLELTPGYHEASFLLEDYVPLSITTEIFEGTETQLDTLLMLGSGCLPEGITFSTQAQIDSFQINYPNCTEIEGNVEISANDITNLNGLNVLTSIGGDLFIHGNDALTTLTGLENLTEIDSGFSILDNIALANLSEFENLSSIGGHLSIYNNDALTNLTGLEHLVSIGAGLSIGNNTSLTDLTGLDNLVNVGGEIRIYYNYGLNSLTGLESLTAISGPLLIYHNNSLTNITALENIQPATIDNLLIKNNPLLTVCQIQNLCDYITNPNGSVTIFDNGIGCNSVIEIGSSCGGSLPCLPFGHYYFNSQSDIDNFQLVFQDCSNIEGDVIIRRDDYDLVNLNGLDVIHTISGSLGIVSSYWGGGSNSLTSLSGLDNLTAIGESLYINGNDSLVSLYGLENLQSIGGDLNIGLVWDFGCSGNGSLTSLAALTNLTSIGGKLQVECNNSLFSLSGLENLEASSIMDIRIRENPSLSDCDIESICAYMAASNGSIWIQNNAPGCNDTAQVNAACLGVSIEEILDEYDFVISPNPVSDLAILSLISESHASIDIFIYNITGLCIKSWKFKNQQPGQKEFTLDLKYLPAGIYFCRVQIGNERVTKKIIKTK